MCQLRRSRDPSQIRTVRSLDLPPEFPCGRPTPVLKSGKRIYATADKCLSNNPFKRLRGDLLQTMVESGARTTTRVTKPTYGMELPVVILLPEHHKVARHNNLHGMPVVPVAACGVQVELLPVPSRRRTIGVEMLEDQLPAGINEICQLVEHQVLPVEWNLPTSICETFVSVAEWTATVRFVVIPVASPDG
uniref:(northern house mosquito) hypothetical protein n=1 Tax=Culex pipiens TaxID=7175 RepID=A0A8D8DQY6_CULPI